jgi:DNA polymerase-1
LAKAKVLKGQYFLFGNTGEVSNWKPPSELPNLEGVKEIAFDTETTGKDKRKDTPIGFSCCTSDGVKFYAPWGHAGGNLNPENVKAWAKEQLRNKKLIGCNIGFDAEMMRRWGVDLEAQGNQLYDISHGAALLNENRTSGFGLSDLGMEYCARPKLDEGLDKSRMSDYHSSMVGTYAEEDAALTWDVYAAQRPLIEKDQLGKVDDLESKLIWPNNHMERSGARLDVPKLEQFGLDLQNELSALTMRIWAATGVRLDPNKVDSWDRLFIQMGRDPNKVMNEKHQLVSSYTEDFLKKFTDEHTVAGLRCRRLLSLKSKYLDKYEHTRRGDFLPFDLFQLRAGEEEKGTVVGRYSSARVNIQQVFKVENQVKRFGDGYIIRELMIPDDGYEMFAWDGSQLQFRLFAHLSQDKDIIRAYHDGYNRWRAGGKDVDFHQMVADLFHLSRQNAKTNNFALVMGMGRAHLSSNIGKACDCQSETYWKYVEGRDFDPTKDFSNNENHAENCPAVEANKMVDEYEASFPSAKKTMEMVVKFAKKNGFVPTLLGRRRRYADSEYRGGLKQKTRYYKALASWLQGSEADIVKSKILRVYNERNNIGIHKMRMPVHDEITGDIDPDPKWKVLAREVLNIQEIPCRVPITWADEYGANWRECSGK